MFVLGMDQGGTKTAAVVADHFGHIVGLGYGPGACHSIDGMDKAICGMNSAISAALTNAGLKRGELSLIYAGVTGADWPYEYELLDKAVGGLLPHVKRVVVNDVVIAMRAGTRRSYGAIIVAGTGANVAFRTPEGKVIVYGYYVGDEDQGARALGRHTLRAVFDSEIGVSGPTVLTEQVLRHTCAENVDKLLNRYVDGDLDQRQINELARVVLASAEAGDQTSVNIVRSFGSRLGSYVAAGLSRYDMADIELEVVLAGGIFKSRSRELIDSIKMRVASVSEKAFLVYSPYEPVVGAVMLGLEELSVSACDAALDNVLVESEDSGLSIDLADRGVV